MPCLFELYSRYYEAAEGLQSDALSALWDEAGRLLPLESMVAAQGLEDSGMDVPIGRRSEFCRLHTPGDDCPRVHAGGGGI